MKKTINNLWFSFKQVFRASPWLFIVSLIISLSKHASSFITMYISKLTINELQLIYTGQATAKDIFPYLIIASLFAVVLSLLWWIESAVQKRQSYAFNQYIDRIYIEKSATLDIAVFDSPKYYNILEDAERSKRSLNFIVYRVIHFISYMGSLLTALAIAFAYRDAYLSFIIILLVIPALISKTKYYTKVYQYNIDNRTLSRKMSYNSKVLLDKNAAKELRFYNTKDYILDKYDTSVTKYVDGEKKILHSYGLFDSVVSVLPMAGVMIAVLVVTKNIINGNGQLGDFVYYMGIFTTIKNDLLAVADNLSKLKESDLAIRRYREFLGIKPLVKTNGTLSIERIETIGFQNVSFTYPKTDNKVLDNLNLKIEIPKKYAILGLNGAGKSTIVKLLLRFYDVDDGKILVNGKDICEYSIESLRKLVAPVFQTPVIYSMSLRTNVALSDLSQKQNDEKILSKLTMFGLNNISDTDLLDHDVTRDFDENGIMLSGGQAQKLSLARFAFHEANLYIMDEPTASLDPISEHEILTDFKTLYADKGMIMISHRLSNVVDLDRIFVIKDGKCIEEGTHDELYSKQGLYYEMFTKQSYNYTSKEVEL